MAQMDTKHTSGTLCNNSGAGSLWVFSCLAHSCAQFSVEEESSLFSTGIRLNVPDTVIFEGGSPRFWLCTHDGRLTRRDLCEHLVTSGGGGASQKSLKESSIDERINHAVEGMRSFWHRTNSKAASNTCIPACVAWYVDGEHETLEMCQLKTLSGNFAWRKQLAALQGYVVPQHVEYGLYRASEDTLFGSGGSIRGGAARVGLNMLTRAVAKCVMGCYAVTNSSIKAGPTVRTTRSTIISQSGQGALLEFMRAVYLIDDQGVLWFSHADVVQTQPSSVCNEPGSSMHVAKCVSAATRLVATELQELLKRATSTGVLLEECFSHFDCRSCGFVDALMLQNGLGQLGIGVSVEVADALVLMLGNGTSTSFRIRDLASFCAQYGTSSGILDESPSPPFAVPTVYRPDSRQVEDSPERVLIVSEQLPDGSAHVAATTNGQNKLSALATSASAIGNRRKKWKFPRRKQMKQQGLRETDFSNRDDSLFLAYSEVTKAPERMSRPLVSVFTESTHRDIAQAHRWDDLPFWARESSRRALRELMHHHTRLLREKRWENSASSMDIMNSETSIVLCDENIDDGVSDAKLATLPIPLSSRTQAGHDSPGPSTSRVGSPLHERRQHGRRMEASRRDSKIHVGAGNIMSYRWVRRATTRPEHGGTVLEATKALSKSRESMGLHVTRKAEFLLIVLPDLLMTLDSMESRLGGILGQNPQGRLLLVGSLGLPGTQWNEGETLDAQLQSRALSNLLLELFQRGELNIDRHLCVVMMGLGYGANTLLRFAATHLLDSSLACLRDSTRFLAVINPFPLTARNSMETQQVRRSLQTLHRVLERGNHHEQVHALTTAFFSDEFVVQNGRRSVLHEFWSHRLGLELPKATRPSSAPTTHRAEGRRENKPGIMNNLTRTPPGEGGTLQCLNGILHGVTFGALCKNINLPILLIASTNDALDSSATIEHFPTSLDAEEVDSFFELVNGQKRRRVLVYPVSAGREILQEAPIRTLKILMDAIQAAQARSFAVGNNGKHREEDPITEGVSQSDEMGYIDREAASVLRPDSSESGDERQHGATPNISGAMSSLYQGGKCENDPPLDEVAEILIEDPPVPGINVATKKSRRAREFDIRKERAAERRTKNERLRKQEEKARLKKAKQEIVERVNQQRELMAMQREDDRSTAVDRYIRDLEAWVLRVAEAKERALELTVTRDSKEQKLAEDRVARDRAAKHLQRVELFQQRKLNMLEEAKVDRSDVVGFTGFIAKHTEVEQAHMGCEKLMEQLLSVRRASINTMKMELLRREQLTTFETQYRKLESELVEAERLQHTYARRGTAADILGDMNLQESRDLEVAVAKQQVQLSSYQSVLKERQEVLDMVVSHLQNLKIALHSRQNEVRTTTDEIKKSAAGLKKKAGRLRAKNDNMIALRANLDSKTAKMIMRSKRLEHEQSRLQAHSDLLFDTDVWQQGVMQRMAADKLGECLQEELDTTRLSIQDNEQHIKRIDETLAVDVMASQEIDLKSRRLTQIVQTTEEKLNRMMSKTIAQELQAYLGAEEETKPLDATTMLEREKGSVADKIRRKPSHERSVEEKQWLALDILVNRPLYDSLSVVEHEELELNDEYKTELRAEDVTRILGLPREIQLSLPHLLSPTEIEAHRLLLAYTHEHGDAGFAKADEDSQGMQKRDGGYSPGCFNTREKLRQLESSAPKQKKRKFILFESMSDVGMEERCCDPHGEAVVRIGERQIYSSATALLQPQESGAHRFSIVDIDPVYSTDLQVVIRFTGCMDTRGFSKGRVSAVLLRTSAPEGSTQMSTKECIGYAPHAKQKLNVGNQYYQTPGTIVIQHRPRIIPIAPGLFEVVVKALGLTEYSVAVFVGQCELCSSLIDKRREEAKRLKARLKDLDSELNDTWATVRLRERQYHVCKTLIEEAEAECERCQDAIDDMCKELHPDVLSSTYTVNEEDLEVETDSSTSSKMPHSSSSTESVSSRSRPTTSSTTNTRSPSDKSLEISETERAETWNEVAAFELEHTHWGRLFTTRCQEKASVKKALDRLMKLRRDLTAEKTCTEAKLLLIANEVPLAVATVRGIDAATDVAVQLSTNISATGTLESSQIFGTVANPTTSFVTPAERTRRVFEREGWDALTLEEQQWVTVDQSMCPDKYLWLRRQLQEENKRKNRKGANIRTKCRKNPAIDQCRFHRDELVRILAEPFGELNRREMHVRKLMMKFHDDPQLIQNADARDLSDHDECTLAQRTRSKNANELTVQEQEWVSLDRILHPQMSRRLPDCVAGTQNAQQPSRKDGGELAHEEKEQWQCPFSRDELFRIWSSCGDASAATQDERRAFSLLTTFNGQYQAEKSTKCNQVWRSVQMGKTAGTLHTDVDKRIRELQLELDRVSHNNNPKMNSSALRVVPQRYPTSTLRLELERQLDLLLREQVQQRERKNNYIIEDYSSSEDETRDSFADGKELQVQKAGRRKARRLKRGESGGDVNIFAARKRVLLDARKTVLQRENAKRVAQLGAGGCQACMSNPCSHTPVLNAEDTNARLDKVGEELHFARMHTEGVIESSVPLSTKRDGKMMFRRIELIEELTSEQKHLRHMLKLHFIDLEFHKANQTTNEHIESVALHGYRTFLWTQHARVALEREHSRLVARLVAIEIADDILDWMLEGWHFGERQSSHESVGYVPSIKKGGFIKPGVDTKMKEAPNAEQEKMLQEQEEDQASTFTLPPGIATSNWSKSTERVVKPGGAHDEEISFMERTTHFGLFCVTLMYFRAKWLLARQKKGVADFKLGWDINTNVPVRAQRRTVTDLTVNSMQAGYQRVKVRKEKEQAEVLADFAGFLAVEKRELAATQLIQQMYRGHIGRKAAQRWSAKRAEYNATNSLMVSAAVTLQRLMRGSWGRSRAKTVRAGIARWLAHLFDDEGREFEAEVLRSNKLEALKRGIGKLAADDDDESESDVSAK